MTKREYDPLSVIPSSDAVERRLQAILEQARKLKIVLKTAKKIEAETAKSEQGVRDANHPA